MKVAVTGASGHIGANLIRELITGNNSINALLHVEAKAFQDVDINIVRGSLKNIASLKHLCECADVVFHLAAQISIRNFNLSQLSETNIEGTRNVIRACRETGVRRLIHFSSIHALDPEPLNNPMDESNPLNLESNLPYERSKALGEKIALETALKDGLEVIVLNPTAVIGPWDFGPSYLGQFLIRLYKGKIPGLVKGGYNWVDARDIAKATISAAKKGRSGERYILSGHWASLTELAQLAGEATGMDLGKPVLPGFIARTGLPFIQALSWTRNEHPLYTRESLQIIRTGNQNVQHQKATKELNYQSRSLLSSLKDTYNWYKLYNYI